MIVIAGPLYVAAQDRDRYLDAVGHITALARTAPGCLDFVQAADPVDPTRINVFERWDSDDSLQAFRGSGLSEDGAPELTGAAVAKYRIASIEAP